MTSMNATIIKFGYPETLLREYHHWVVLVRPSQVTAGSLVLAAKSDVTEFGRLPVEAFGELAAITQDIETALQSAIHYNKINYLMLMMVDPHVHFHVLPRHQNPRSLGGILFADDGWPGPPALASATALNSIDLAKVKADLSRHF